MRKNYRVLWAFVAEEDLRRIIDAISTKSPGNALRVFQRIRQATESLTTLLERGRIVPELRDQGVVMYRDLLIASWRLIYRIADKKVYVLSVLDSRRNLEDILLDRLIR